MTSRSCPRCRMLYHAPLVECPWCGWSRAPLALTPRDKLWLALAVIVGAIGGLLAGICGGGI